MDRPRSDTINPNQTTTTADTKDIEVLVGKEATEPVDASKTGKSEAKAPKEEGTEVSGRAYVHRHMECWNCDGISWIWYDTARYHSYECCYCGAINVL